VGSLGEGMRKKKKDKRTCVTASHGPSLVREEGRLSEKLWKSSGGKE